ncbi:MAG: hypothetical protein ACRDKE_06620 [Solirubrobacterales bacterium]
MDEGVVPGVVGSDPSAYFLRAIGRDSIWPYWEVDPDDPTPSYFGGRKARWEDWDEDTLFDVVEALHDLVSEPKKGRHHSYGNCGWHYETFDRKAGRHEYREAIEDILQRADPALEFDEDGQLFETAPSEFRPLFEAEIPSGNDHDLIDSKIDSAVRRFQLRGTAVDEKRVAVRELADVLEAIRPDVKLEMLSDDENALFNLANNFAIRHNNRAQKTDYDGAVWLRWAFYVYLATIHAVLRTREAKSGQKD